MSLINDALKQTKHVRPPDLPSGPPPLPPVEATSQSNLGWLAMGIIVLLLLVAGIFLGLSLFKPAPLTAGSMPVTKPVSAVPTRKMETAVTTPLAATNAASSTNVMAVAPPQPPGLKLQGILFSPVRPCAIVSGKTVFVGDRLSNFRVAAISKDTITLQSETETKVLSLNPQ